MMILRMTLAQHKFWQVSISSKYVELNYTLQLPVINFPNKMIVVKIARKHPELERQVLQTHKDTINMGGNIQPYSHNQSK